MEVTLVTSDPAVGIEEEPEIPVPVEMLVWMLPLLGEVGAGGPNEL
jgi:hypothetical protein